MLTVSKYVDGICEKSSFLPIGMNRLSLKLAAVKLHNTEPGIGVGDPFQKCTPSLLASNKHE